MESEIMKRALFLLLCGAMASQATIIHFDISPAGSDAALGLSPSNQVPAITNSTGSGNEISGGITFDTDSMVLDLAIGYGSAAGFTDLSGVPTAMHIHGPARAGENADVLVDLAPYNFSAANATNGGVIIGSIAYPSNAVASLLGGSNYVNIHTALNPNGEIRGQLVPVVVSNSPPIVQCPDASSAECSSPAIVSVIVSDPEGDALTVVWTVNGSVVQTNALPASDPPAEQKVSFVGVLPLGTNVIGVSVTDSATNTTTCGTMVTVADTIPPVITSASASPNVLWPPNHKMVNVTVAARVTDRCSDTTWKIIAVTSNQSGDSKGNGKSEARDGKAVGHSQAKTVGGGDGNTSPDWVITGDHTLQLRAERSGNSGDRVYCITLQAIDASGDVSLTKKVTVTVPHNK
jgi:hypothetical protein